MARWSLHPTASNHARIMLIPAAFGVEAQVPSAILNAGADLCAFEPLLQIDTDQLLIAQHPALDDEPPYGMCEAAVRQALRRQQWPVLLPSTMPASWGAIRGIWKHHAPLWVIHCSAHASLMPGSEQAPIDQEARYTPTAWVEQIYQAQLPITHVGLRSSTAKALQWIQAQQNPVFWAQREWTPIDVVASVPKQMPVFLALDLGVLDPSTIPAVPAPEPGGVTWNRLTQTCQLIFSERSVVGMALGGLTIMPQTKQSARVAARLLNWLLACYALSHTRSISPSYTQDPTHFRNFHPWHPQEHPSDPADDRLEQHTSDQPAPTHEFTRTAGVDPRSVGAMVPNSKQK